MRTERLLPRTSRAAAREAGPKLVSMHDIDGSVPPSARDSASEPLSATAYAVLGILSVTDEELTPGEIRLRAEFAFRHFYWSPAVSHIRRELRRLVEMGLAAEREIAIGQVRRSQVYQTTAEGEQALARWVADGPLEEPVVVKNPVLLRVFLGDKAPRQTILSLIDARLRQVEQDIRETQWGRRRSAELGLDQQASLRFPMAVSEYKLRSLYFEQGNLRQLRDTIVGFDTESFKQDKTHERGALRRRHREVPPPERPSA
jgi:DNA-binding PadR family transcriptional regulator